MDKPRLPGFTAEAAVAATRQQHYWFSVGAALEGGVQRVHPSLRPWSPPRGCNPNCACLSWEGCPCCTGPGPGDPWSVPWLIWG